MTKICPIIQFNVTQLGKGVGLPDKTHANCTFNERRVGEIMAQDAHSLPVIDEFLKHTNDEKQVLEGLYIVSKMAEKKTSGIEKIYPTISRFNNANSPNIQNMLAEIWEKL